MSWRSKKSGPNKGQHFRVEPGKGKSGPTGDVSFGPEEHLQTEANETPEEVQRAIEVADLKFAAAKTPEAKEAVIEETKAKADRMALAGHNIHTAPNARFEERKNEDAVRTRIAAMEHQIPETLMPKELRPTPPRKSAKSD